MKTLRFLTLCALSFCCFAARPGDFRVLGPGGGGAMFNPAISPHDKQTVLVSCDMTGAYITHDGGESWRMFNLRGTIRFFVFDPKDPQVLYAQATGLWRSLNGGESWQLLYPAPASVKAIQMNSDHADEKIIADPDPLGAITALAIDPKDSHVLYAASVKGSEAALFVSRDFGASWQREATLPERALHIWVDPDLRRGGPTLLIAGARSVTRHTSSGTQSSPAPESVTFSSLAAGFNERGEPVLYGTSRTGVFVSLDQGVSWQKCTLPGTGARVRAVATSLRHPDTAYLSFNELSLDGKSWEGVAKTTDCGRIWDFAWKEASSPAANVHDAWITPRFGPGWGENPLMMAVADDDPSLAYTTDLGRTMKTTDGGRTWRAVYSRQAAGGGWSTTGLDVTTSYGIHFDPFDRKRQFITYTDIGLFRSEDGGQSWVSSTEGVPRSWWNTTYWIAFDPDVRGRMWSVNSGTHDLPRPKMWRRSPTRTYKGGVCLSEDGGRTWRKSNTGMEETAATHILLDPRSPANARTLYVAAFGRGVYKSTDGGRSWALSNSGIAESEPFAWRLALSADGTLYLVLARRSEDGSIGNRGDGAVYRSTDAARTWTRVALPAGVNGPTGIATDPHDPRRVYLSAWARAVGTHGESGGIYVSEDGGATWKQVLDRDQHVYDVTLDPRDPSVLYATGFESSAWRSSDRGEHWARISGFNFKWGHRVIPDPIDRARVYISTFGGSVWHGSVNGEPRPLNIFTPVMEPGR